MLADPDPLVGAMPSPAQVTLDLTPSSRLDVIDVRRVLRRTYGDQLSAFPHALYVSYHTTAGYVDQRLSAAFDHDPVSLQSYVRAY